MGNVNSGVGGELLVPSKGDVSSPSPNITAQDTSEHIIEVDLLCLESLAKVARAIALRVKMEIQKDDKEIQKQVPVLLVATQYLLEKLKVHHSVTAQIVLLQSQMDDILAAPSPENQAESKSLVLSTVANGLSGLQNVISSLNGFLSELQGAEQYTSVGVESALISTLAGQLSQQGFKVLLPGIIVPQPKEGNGILSKLTGLGNKKELAAAKINDLNVSAKAAIAEVEGLFSLLLKVPEGSQQSCLLSDLVAVDGVSQLLNENSGFILVPEIVASGGSYRTTLLSKLFFGGQSYSGGVAVSFLLLDGDSVTLKTGDTLYYSTGHIEFPKRFELFKGNNLEAGS